MILVSVLFARSDSNYKSLADCDVWDAERDALNWPGGLPVVAHPPCKAWGKLRGLAKPGPGEKDLARWAVRQVREWGGVLEHPEGSALWFDQGMQSQRKRGRDEFGGWTLAVDQFWWGHRARKRTLLYIVGCEPKNIPAMPFCLGTASHVVSSTRRKRVPGSPILRPVLSPVEREHTPPELCRWLVDLASRCVVSVCDEVV